MRGIDWNFFLGGEALGVCSSTAVTDFALCRPLLSTPMNGRSVACAECVLPLPSW